MRLAGIALLIAIVLIIPFVLWGESFTRALSGTEAIVTIRSWGAWGGVIVIGLLMSDLLLPIPATPVISAAGYLYGAVAGGLLGAAGSFASGMLGYLLSRSFGRALAVRLAGEKALSENEALFHRSGPWLVAASRWLPLLPEVVSCLAGLTRMRPRTFMVALACGSLPLGFVYAAIGAAGQQEPKVAIVLSIAAPPVLWLFVRRLFR